VTKFPGAIGIDIANEIDRAVQDLKGCDRLIIDLRGNAGGGLAFLRIMSYLTPDRVPVGYSVTRAHTWRGELLETKGVTPDCEANAGGTDDQLARAVDVVRSL
jgi:C-terminal processing protease CtpA/Prc